MGNIIVAVTFVSRSSKDAINPTIDVFNIAISFVLQTPSKTVATERIVWLRKMFSSIYSIHTCGP